MRQTIRTPWNSEAPPDATRVALRAERTTIARRRWRGVAEDGREFAFDLERPLRDGAIFRFEEDAAYVVEQLPEPVLEAKIMDPAQLAIVAWRAGSLQIPVEIDGETVRLPDESNSRMILEKACVRADRLLWVLHPVESP